VKSRFSKAGQGKFSLCPAVQNDNVTGVSGFVIKRMKHRKKTPKNNCMLSVFCLHCNTGIILGNSFELVMAGRIWFVVLLLFSVNGLLRAQVSDSLKAAESPKPELIQSKTDTSAASPAAPAPNAELKTTGAGRNEKTILNPLKEKQDNSMYYKLNYAGHHLHKAGRNAIAVGGILVSSVAAVLLFNTVFKPKVSDDYIPINFVYSGLALSFILCSTKGGYHLARAGKSLKDPRFFKQDKTIYDP
jgi:hypothetical protein